MSRFARDRRVLYFEEPVVGDGPRAAVATRGAVTVVTPHIPASLSATASIDAQRRLVDETLARFGVDEYVLWLQTPMALDVARHLSPRAVVYDCMDELSAFLHAPEALPLRERELLDRADVVFTGGESLRREAHAPSAR